MLETASNDTQLPSPLFESLYNFTMTINLASVLYQYMRVTIFNAYHI